MRRGRPPYPDVLTPREQEVLTLIREGLTNDQIATRLGISESGARYHVSEILSKLGVESRYEAAQWVGEIAAPRRFRLSLPHLSPMLLAGSAVATAAVAFVGLAVGVLIMDAREEEVPGPTASPPVQVRATVIPVNDPTADPQAAPANPDEFMKVLLEYGYETYRYARAATSDPALCQCPGPQQSPWLQAPRFGPGSCKSIGPELRTSPDYVPALHADLVSVLIDACTKLDAVDDATFFANARSSVGRIEPILVAEAQKGPSPGQATVLGPITPRPPKAPPGLYGTDVRTGFAEVDNFLDLVYGSDWNRLAAEAYFRDVPCTFAWTIGARECGLAEPEGTLYSVVPIGGCEAGPTERVWLERSLSILSSRFLHAAFEMDISWAPNTKYIILFRTDPSLDFDVQILLDGQGRLTGMSTCGSADWLPGPNDHTILPRPS